MRLCPEDVLIDFGDDQVEDEAVCNDGSSDRDSGREDLAFNSMLMDLAGLNFNENSPIKSDPGCPAIAIASCSGSASNGYEKTTSFYEATASNTPGPVSIPSPSPSEPAPAKETPKLLSDIKSLLKTMPLPSSASKHNQATSKHSNKAYDRDTPPKKHKPYKDGMEMRISLQERMRASTSNRIEPCLEPEYHRSLRGIVRGEDVAAIRRRQESSRRQTPSYGRTCTSRRAFIPSNTPVPYTPVPYTPVPYTPVPYTSVLNTGIASSRAPTSPPTGSCARGYTGPTSPPIGRERGYTGPISPPIGSWGRGYHGSPGNLHTPSSSPPYLSQPTGQKNPFHVAPNAWNSNKLVTAFTPSYSVADFPPLPPPRYTNQNIANSIPTNSKLITSVVSNRKFERHENTHKTQKKNNLITIENTDQSVENVATSPFLVPLSMSMPPLIPMPSPAAGPNLSKQDVCPNLVDLNDYETPIPPSTERESSLRFLEGLCFD
ncbi:hypothetical protein DFH27DRAFT_22551 [Peziza echinospora]|nr:hypothetical protein DFH27DRAFT_22551 [Peziza echinospora]